MTDREALARELREAHAAIAYPLSEGWHPPVWESLPRHSTVRTAWLAVADRVMEREQEAFYRGVEQAEDPR